MTQPLKSSSCCLSYNMGKLSIDVEAQLEVMMKYGLTAEEYFVTQLLFLATEDPPHPEFLISYFVKAAKTSMPVQTLDQLRVKGVLHKDYKVEAGMTFRLEDVQFDAKFLNEHFKLTLEGGAELKNHYPDFLQGFDKLLPAKNIVTGGYRSEEDFFFAYSKAIKHSRKKHDEVMNILEWAKAEKLITYGMVEYVTTKKWEDHIKMRETGSLGGQTVRLETLEGL